MKQFCGFRTLCSPWICDSRPQRESLDTICWLIILSLHDNVRGSCQAEIELLRVRTRPVRVRVTVRRFKGIEWWEMNHPTIASSSIHCITPKATIYSRRQDSRPKRRPHPFLEGKSCIFCFIIPMLLYNRLLRATRSLYS